MRLACHPAAPLTFEKTPFSAQLFPTCLTVKSSRRTSLSWSWSRGSGENQEHGNTDAGPGSHALPGAARAPAVGQGCATPQFGIFGPSGAAAVLAQPDRLQFAPTHGHSERAKAHWRLPATAASLNVQPLIISRRPMR